MLKRVLVVVIVVTLMGAGLFFWLTRPTQPDLRLATVQVTDVTQEVAFTGRLMPKQSIDLAFELSGQIESVLIGEGELVTPNQTLLTLDPATVALELDKARADLASAREQAKLKLDSASHDLSALQAENEQLRLKRRQAVIDANQEVIRAKSVWQESLDENDDETSATTETNRLTFAKAQSAYNTAQKQLSETLATIGKTEQSKADAKNLANAQYLATVQAAGNLSGLSSLGALQELARLRVAKSQLTSPIAGTVTALNLDPGEYATAGQTAVTIATADQLELVAQVPESDALKLALGQSGQVTFDALAANQIWNVSVTKIATAARIIEGVPTYEVTLILDGDTSHLKPGLTANINITAGRTSQTIAVPRRAIITNNGRQFVRVLDEAGDIYEQDVETGLIGTSGLVEITSGLNDQQQVLLDGTN